MKPTTQLQNADRVNTAVWVVDDDKVFNRVISQELRGMGFNVTSFTSGQYLKDRLKEESCDLLLLDLQMPDQSGQETLEEVKKTAPEVMVIVLTGHGTLENAVIAMKAGAYDFLSKPCELDQLEVVLCRAREAQLLKYQNALLRRELARRDPPVEMVGQSTAFRSLLRLIQRVGSTDATVLIQGESGTGKELAARALHHYSERHPRPFVVVDCSTLHDQLLESELFGHERGAYTGAISTKHGLFEVADSGTVFLDEIGEMSLTIQAKLLRFLETREFRRVGSTRDLSVDVRIIAATNKSLAEATRAGQFREDLYYRLNVITLTIPPLRDRKEDIPLLVDHFLQSLKTPDIIAKQFTVEAMDRIMHYNWPGNLRELKNAIARALILADEEEIGPEHLPKLLGISNAFMAQVQDSPQYLTIAQLEREYITWVLRQVEGKKEQAASILDIDPKTLYRKLKAWGVGQ